MKAGERRKSCDMWNETEARTCRNEVLSLFETEWTQENERKKGRNKCDIFREKEQACLVGLGGVLFGGVKFQSEQSLERTWR